MTGGESDRGVRRMGDLGEGGVGGRRGGLLDLDVKTVASDMPRGLYGEMEGRWKVESSTGQDGKRCNANVQIFGSNKDYDAKNVAEDPRNCRE